ncbi:MAG: 5-(carboxyamino)imidazole ribonucleotide mutase [Gemmatimonadota bacterium]|nr:5-(carboxyamino)imidazole ribonucleotide mutase [Gemmatimonadota bacterium]
MSETARPTFEDSPLVSILMGSKSDWEEMKQARDVLDQFEIANESLVSSAHRTPRHLVDYVSNAESSGIEVIIAGAGGAAHLPGVVAAHTLVPVLGVPMESKALKGMDSLLSIVQMPRGIPVATFAIGGSGAANAGLFAVSILANSRPELREKLKQFRETQANKILNETLD